MRLAKLNNSGIAHILVLLVVVVGVGIVGSYFIFKSHASSYQVSCYANGRKSGGYAQYNCGWYTTVPVYRGSTAVGSFNSGTNWILCQQRGVEYYHGRYYNYWWAYTLSNQSTWGWANAVYGSGGVNNGSFTNNVPNCNGAFGPTPTITTS